MNGIFFDLQTVRARDLGALAAALLTDGRLSGCALTCSGANLTISKGYLIANGRLIEIAQAETITSASPNPTGYGRLKLVIDLAEAASQTAFLQAAFAWDYATSNSFTALSQTDINDGTSTTYEMEICRCAFANGGINAVVTLMGDAAVRASLAALGAQPARLTFTGKTVATSAWTSDAAYADYPYRAAVACAGVTAEAFADVVLSPEDAAGGNFAPVCATYAGGVYLYAKAVPDAALTIPTIIIWR